MASFGTLLRLEFAKAIRRPMTWILGIILVGFMGFMFTVLTLATFVTEQQEPEQPGMEGLREQLFLPDGLAFGSSRVVGVGAVVMIIFGAGLYGSEFSWATVRMMLLMRASRTQFVFVKLMMILLMSVLVALVGMAIVFVGSFAAEVLIGDVSDATGRLTPSLFGDALIITLRSIVAIAMWGLIGGMLALATSSMAVGTGIALAGYFIGDLIVQLIAQVGTVGEWVARIMPTYGINGMVVLNQVTSPDFSNAEIVGMVASLIVWTIAFIVLGYYRFRGMDVIAAST